MNRTSTKLIIPTPSTWTGSDLLLPVDECIQTNSPDSLEQLICRNISQSKDVCLKSSFTHCYQEHTETGCGCYDNHNSDNML